MNIVGTKMRISLKVLFLSAAVSMFGAKLGEISGDITRKLVCDEDPLVRSILQYTVSTVAVAQGALLMDAINDETQIKNILKEMFDQQVNENSQNEKAASSVMRSILGSKCIEEQEADSVPRKFRELYHAIQSGDKFSMKKICPTVEAVCPIILEWVRHIRAIIKPPAVESKNKKDSNSKNKKDSNTLTISGHAKNIALYGLPTAAVALLIAWTLGLFSTFTSFTKQS